MLIDEVNWDRIQSDHLRDAGQLLDKLQLDAILVNDSDTVKYLVPRFRPIILDEWYCHSTFAALAKGSNAPVLVAPEYSFEEQFPRGSWKAPFGGWVCSLAIPDEWAETLANLMIQHLRLPEDAVIGVDCLPFGIYEKLHAKLPKVRFSAIMRQLLEIRAVKTQEEIKVLRRTAQIVREGVETGFSILGPGVTERQVYGRMMQKTFEMGAESAPWTAYLSSGQRSLANEFPTDQVINEGDMVNADIGCTISGYHGDIGRTSVFGKPSREAKELFAILMDVHKTGIRTMAPGVRVSEIDRRFREALKEHGYVYGYGAASGHGIGLRTFELPVVFQGGSKIGLDMELKPGMVLSIEPNASKAGVGNVNFDDMVLVTESGREVLTGTSYSEDLFR